LENRRKIEEELLQLLKESMTEMSQVAGRLGWEGRVALIQGNKVYLNVGEKSGLRVGDLLRVSQLGDEVYDPQSGKWIGRTPGRMKGTVEVVGFFGEDGAIAVIHSGGGFQVNDRVQVEW
jgi:hypothetical protein